MAKFCSKCGKILLKDDEICECQQGVEDGETKEQNDIIEENGIVVEEDGTVIDADELKTDEYYKKLKWQQKKEYAKGKIIESGELIAKWSKLTWENLCLMWRDPVNSARNYVREEGIGSSIILYILQAIISSMFAIVVAIIFNFDGVGATISVAKSFFLTMLYSIVFSIISTGLWFLSVKVFRIGLSYKNVVNIVATKCSSIILMDFIASILYIFSPLIGVTLYITSVVVGMISVIFVFYTEALVDDDQKARAIIFVIVLFALIVVLLIPRMFDTYISHEIKEKLDFIWTLFMKI